VTAIADGIPAASYAIRPTSPDDLRFVRDSWRESAHRAASMRRLPWAAFKLLHGSVIDDLLGRPDVYTIAAYDDSRAKPIVGWLAWSHGRVPAVHYCYTRFDDRRAGIATALLRSPLAGLGDRMIYTCKGVKPKHGDSMDVVMESALRRRGVAVAYVQIREYLRTVGV
jgi:GNAT superfamily N-acetyltransferase